MSQQFDNNFDSEYIIIDGQKCKLITPHNDNDLSEAYKVRVLIANKLSMLMHDEDGRDYLEEKLKDQNERIEAYLA